MPRLGRRTANAGIQAFRPLLEMEDPDWHIQIDVNLTGTANGVRAFAPYGAAETRPDHCDHINSGTTRHAERLRLFSFEVAHHRLDEVCDNGTGPAWRHGELSCAWPD